MSIKIFDIKINLFNKTKFFKVQFYKMCDVKKYNEFKEEFYKLSYQDFMQLIDESEDEESRKFFVGVLSSITQNNQSEIIKKGIK